MIRQGKNRTILKTFLPVPLGAPFVAEFGQCIRHALMRLGMAWVETEGSFKVLPSSRILAALQEDITQVHVANGVFGMVRHCFRVNRARSGSITGGMQKRTQIVQREAVRRFARQYLDIGVSGFQIPAHLVE